MVRLDVIARQLVSRLDLLSDGALVRALADVLLGMSEGVDQGVNARVQLLQVELDVLLLGFDVFGLLISVEVLDVLVVLRLLAHLVR